MRYTFFLYSDEAAFADAGPAEIEQSLKVFGEYIAMLKQAGVLVDTDWLQPSATATSISKVGGVRKIQDGPFADTKEQLGGTFVIDVPDLDAALAWAEKCPAVHYGTIEIRASAMPEGGNPYA
ncbi:YciI family protein [Hoeflea prorocentri]|uniref:YciI family protein n=1 Tax=Hoeflea prorocentri TaxID=1922333 RepID=A0A9X3ZJN8_9HYPH|nr:YciI family protein [Hoeflea prorocentri]MCY6382995.1 YciI family protein [Hoeflea prorocentri]MDA5400795.1 YciI family protein [Hoeflea prorocentri]